MHAGSIRIADQGLVLALIDKNTGCNTDQGA